MNSRTSKRNQDASRGAHHALTIDGSYMNEDLLPEEDERAGRDDQQFHTVGYDDILAANLNKQALANSNATKGTWFSNILANTRRSSKRLVETQSQYLNTNEKMSEHGDRLMQESQRERRVGGNPE